MNVHTPTHTLRQKAATNSMESQSNGALMRATPLAIWGHMLPPDQLAEHARAEAR